MTRANANGLNHSKWPGSILIVVKVLQMARNITDGSNHSN